jgi:hypothetical protein
MIVPNIMRSGKNLTIEFTVYVVNVQDALTTVVTTQPWLGSCQQSIEKTKEEK